ncbi:conserved oligomeric Golgi complex subunit 1 isoform X2 [Periplaneta americana]|uniref:conserved oligomeric Golgi complex subunit 1 isoform X2 n=1 Tax=Periplaneta americana TaxID=6978 RepID=UPI0037E904A6
MPVQNLLDINTDKLFEEHTVSEILETQKKLQIEIERKREELRTMVGERYRDLIEAADTIGDMKQTAEGIISHIDNMSVKCQQLQQKHLLGFKVDSNNTKAERISVNKTYHSIAIQIKILMDIPEQIWSAVEKEDYILGAQLFLFARHINTGLQLHAGVDEILNSSKVLLWFPVITRQWSAISHFRDAILTGCQNMLQSHSLTSEEASSCLSTLVLLEGIGSLELLKKLLQLRTQALENVLQSDSHDSVKARVCTSLKLLVHTITLLYSCFLDDGQDSSQPEGLIWKQLKNIVGRNAPPAISLVDLKDLIATKFLPQLVQEFRPSTTEPVNPVPPEDMRENVIRWLDWVRDFIQKQVTSLLNLVSSVRGLHAIREEASSLGTAGNWDKMCQHLTIPCGLNIWDAYFQTLLTERAKSLVSHQWNIALTQLQSTLINVLQENSQEKCSQPEHDLRWFVWKEWSSDLPQGDSSQNQQQKRGLLMKTKGYSPCVERLCAELDSQLLALLQDLQYYLQNESVISDKVTDRNELQDHLQKCSMESIQKLLQFIKTQCLSEVEGKSVHDACVVMIARFLQALCDLCPNLQKCFSLSQNNNSIKTVVSSTPASSPWQDACSLLQQESVTTWQKWQYLISNRLTALAKAKLCQPQNLSTLLHSIPQWDVVSIEEEAEEGRSIRSDIKVPSQPSLPLQSLLDSMAKQMNAVAPHTLPRKIHQDLVEFLVDNMFGHYEDISNNAIISQAQALQLLLDIKYLTMLLVPRDNKALMGKSQVISDKFEDKIDPFDLDVFCPYIQNNIKRSVQRTQGLLGVLVAWPEKLAIVSGLRAATSNTVEDPSVLSLCNNAPWFSLLPVTGPPGTRILIGIPQIHTDKPQFFSL